ncbi:MAG: hypothetical protein LKF75_01085 [Bacilli bacterium]|jgi:hypothetical protein|nr:hypothetical protein [Bacilli bacterium]MCH4210486.1 hypothetical protein [Bacilli bacterium]MCH4228290.1 hypothetical protein [Bacilli bacterium]MCH4277361.1 hypothetical protein [Bacilli bacterium]
MPSGTKNSSMFDKTLALYQKLCLFLLYPPLISMVTCFIGSFNDGYDYYLSLASERSLMMFLRENPIGSNVSMSMLLGDVVSIIVLALFVVLTIYASKGKVYCLAIGAALYLADTVYLCFLCGSSLPYSMEAGSWGLQFALHVIFFLLYVASFFVYGKLLRLLKENRGH